MLKTKFTNGLMNTQQLRSKGTALFIEHLPCCILSFSAGFLGLPLLNHNPHIELGFAIGGAIIGEYAGHKFFNKNHVHAPGFAPTAKRYAISLAIGLASWGAHQQLFHDHTHHEHTETETHATHQHFKNNQEHFMGQKTKFFEQQYLDKTHNSSKTSTPKPLTPQ